MQNGTGALRRSIGNHNHSTSRAIAKGILAGIAIGGVALAGAWGLLSHFSGPEVEVVAVRPAEPPKADEPALSYIYIESELIYSPTSLGVRAKTLSQSAPVASTFRYAARPAPKPQQQATRQQVAPQPEVVASKPEVSAPAQPAVKLVQSVVVPRPRPAELNLPKVTGPTLHTATTTHRDRVLAALKALNRSPDKRSIFQRLFGGNDEPQTALGYAAAGDNDAMSPRFASALADEQVTAIYDITARTVYMPDGSKLEAHSGLGDKLDNPRYANVRMHGVTPPHVYDLKLREALFHGVEAIRLTPVGGEGEIYGRTGLLAHTYMLGPNGDSNGCVSFKNYQAFLRAFKNNEVKRLVVVGRMS
jgi:hypothetical protein